MPSPQDHVGAPVIPPRQLNPAVPISLEGVILRALAKPPEDRYASGRELLRALEDELAGDPGRAAGGERTRRPAPAQALAVDRGAASRRSPSCVAVLWATGVFAQKSTVPNVVGATLTSAQATLTNAGFKLGTVGYQQGVGKPQGTILSQTPGRRVVGQERLRREPRRRGDDARRRCPT